MSDEEFDALNARFPAEFSAKQNRHPQVSLDSIVTEWGPLDASHIAAAREYVESGNPLGVTVDLKSIRHTHHRAAQLLAAGMDENRVAVLCNYTPQRISQMKAVPAFADLLAYYKKQVDVEFADFVSSAAALSQDILQEIQRRMDEEPEKISPSMLNEFLKTLADRSGNAPVQRSLNVNVNTDLAERMQAARARYRAIAETASESA